MEAVCGRYDIPCGDDITLFGTIFGLLICYVIFRISTWIASKFYGPYAGDSEFWFMLIIFGPPAIWMIIDVLGRL